MSIFKDANELPLRTSIREIAFTSEAGHVFLKIKYDVNTVRIDPQVNALGNVLRKALGMKYSQNEITIPLKNMDQGEDVYVQYKDLLELVGSIVDKHAEVDDESTYNEKIAGLVKKSKEELPDEILREQAGIDPITESDDS